MFPDQKLGLCNRELQRWCFLEFYPNTAPKWLPLPTHNALIRMHLLKHLRVKRMLTMRSLWCQLLRKRHIDMLGVSSTTFA